MYDNDTITRVVIEFVSAPSKEAKRKIVEQHWEVLKTEEADAVMINLLADGKNTNEEVDILRMLRYLLYKCRNEGITQAFENSSLPGEPAIKDIVIQFVNANSQEKARKIYEQFYVQLQSPEASEILRFMALYFNDDKEKSDQIKKSTDQLKKCRNGHIEGAFSPQTIETTQHVRDILIKFLCASDFGSQKIILLDHKDILLDNETLLILDRMIFNMQESMNPAIKELLMARALLQRCKADGIDTVVGSVIHKSTASTTTNESEMHSLMQELNRMSPNGLAYFSEEGIRGMLQRRPELKDAWEDYRQKNTIGVKQGDPGRDQLNELLGQIDRVEKDDFKHKIELLYQALSIPLAAQLPLLWASLQSMLGTALSQCPGENRQLLIEEAIKHFKLALTIYDAEEYPYDRTIVLNNLGIAYGQLSTGDPAQNEDEAIRCFEEVKLIYKAARKPLPIKLLTNLGGIYVTRINGKPRDNFDKALEYLNLAHSSLDHKTQPIDKADVLYKLGNLYSLRMSADILDDIERAIGYYQQALDIYSTFPANERIGMLHISIASNFLRRKISDQDENLHAAIYHAEQALPFFSPNAWPDKWAEVNNLWAAIFVRQASSNDDLKKAIAYYECALTVFLQKTYPMDWAKAHFNIAVAWSAMIDDEDAIKKAIEHNCKALQIYTKNAYPERWSGIHHSMGQMYARVKPLTEEFVKKANEHFLLSLECRPKELFPLAAFECISGLTGLHFENKDWRMAQEYCAVALQISRDIFSSHYTFAGQRHQLESIGEICQMNAFCLIRLGRFREALYMIEEGKTRLLAEAMAITGIDDSSLSEEDLLALSSVRAEVANAEADLKIADTINIINSPEANRLRLARKNITRLVNDIRKKDPNRIPTVISQEKLLEMIPGNGALVIPFVTDAGCFVFVIPHGAGAVLVENVIEIPELTTGLLQKLLKSKDKGAGVTEWVYGQIQLHAGNNTIWQNTLSEVTGILWTLLMGKVFERLNELEVQKGAQVIIMPQGILGIFPLHAAWHEVNEQREYFCDMYVTSYIPSGYVWELTGRRKRSKPADGTLLAVINPTGDLPHCSHEGDVVCAEFDNLNCTRLSSDATTESVIMRSDGVSHIHFACHGSHVWMDPLRSKIVLAGGNALNFSDIITKMTLHSCDLVVLSACETGLTDLRTTPDEFLGLPLGFIQAGAKAVISSLWAVNDFSTMLLMKKFYQLYLREGLIIADALHKAQSWLRNVSNQELTDHFQNILRTEDDKNRSNRNIARKLLKKYKLHGDVNDKPFSHPHYWAAFVLTGV